MITLHVNIPFYVLFTTISPNDSLVHFIVNYVAKLLIFTISMFSSFVDLAQSSLIAVQSEPKCYADTGICKVARLCHPFLSLSQPDLIRLVLSCNAQVTWKPDVIRTGSLYVPAVSVATVLYLGVVTYPYYLYLV